MTQTTIATTEPDHPTITLRSPADLVAATPYLLGFHPTDSLVVLAFQGSRLAFAARIDVPGPADLPEPIARDLLDVVDRREVEAIAIISYGPGAQVDPLRRAVRAAADRRDLPVKDVLQVEGGRWWSDLCDDPECCPPEGTPVDHTASEVAAGCAFAGLSAAPSRRDRAREVAPIGGLTRASMNQATDRAQARLAELVAALPVGQRADAVIAEGTAAVDAAIDRYAEGGTLDDDELAWVSVLLELSPVRDVAWRAISTVEPHRRLWTDVTRRADPALVPAPASLLAFAAWRDGDGVLAGLALERALRIDPSYSMARLLADGLARGVSPAALADWGTPEWAERVERDLRRQRQQASRSSKAASRKPRRRRSK